MLISLYWQHFGDIDQRHLRIQNPGIIFRHLLRHTWSYLTCANFLFRPEEYFLNRFFIKLNLSTEPKYEP
jgi:hypothetical protein